MKDTERTLRVLCDLCGRQSWGTYAVADLRVTKGRFEPVHCPQCGQRTAEPTAPPFSLTQADRKFLRALRIEDDDPNPGPLNR